MEVESLGFGLSPDTAEAIVSLAWALDCSAAKQQTERCVIFLAIVVALTSLGPLTPKKGTAEGTLAFWPFPGKPLLL